MPILTGPASRLYKPIYNCNIKNDFYASSSINMQFDSIFDILSILSNGDISYNGVYKLEYNQVENSLDILYCTETAEIVVMRISNTEISI